MKDDDTDDDNEQSSDHLIIRHLSVGSVRLVVHRCHECPKICVLFYI
jgi:hypothetical protein